MSPKPSILATNPFYYYDDLAQATGFYTETLGLPVVADLGFAVMVRTSPTSTLTLMDVAYSQHSPDEAKSVTTAFVTEQVEDWHAYLTSQNVPMRFNLTPDSGKAHEGFVALDPAGYYLEFERFNPHPENTQLLPRLQAVEPLVTGTPQKLPISATILWLYYEDLTQAQAFWTDVIGLSLVVDQGFAQVYCPSPSGFIGPVIAGQGMHTYSPTKLVTVGLVTDDLSGWQQELADVAEFGLVQGDAAAVDPSLAERVKFFYGQDPGGYLIEFDQMTDRS